MRKRKTTIVTLSKLTLPWVTTLIGPSHLGPVCFDTISLKLKEAVALHSTNKKEFYYRTVMHALSRRHAQSILGNPIDTLSVSVLVGKKAEEEATVARARSATAGACQARFLDEAHQRPGPRCAWKLLPRLNYL